MQDGDNGGKFWAKCARRNQTQHWFGLCKLWRIFPRTWSEIKERNWRGIGEGPPSSSMIPAWDRRKIRRNLRLRRKSGLTRVFENVGSRFWLPFWITRFSWFNLTIWDAFVRLLEIVTIWSVELRGIRQDSSDYVLFWINPRALFNWMVRFFLKKINYCGLWNWPFILTPKAQVRCVSSINYTIVGLNFSHWAPKPRALFLFF